jgi:phosphoribosylaminoimidazole-succinocarboxamide synthase
MGFTPGTLLREGKTKKIWSVQGNARLCLVQMKDDTTAGNGARHDVIEGKGVLACAIATSVFELLYRCGIPLAFHNRVDDTRFLAKRCTMIPYEVVIRREAHGSYLKRHPMVPRRTRFPELLVEFYLKTTGRRFGDHALPCDDPLVLFRSGAAELYLPDVELSRQAPFLVLTDYPLLDRPEVFEEMTANARMVFGVLEHAWTSAGRVLCDLKIEFGFTATGDLVVADDIENGCWRVLEGDQYIDKQRYRDGATVEATRALYEHVASLTSSFPKIDAHEVLNALG